MPSPSRWMIRSSLFYLAVGFFLGALLLIHKAYHLHPAIWMILPVHIEMLIFGWVIQLTLGTAYWILPRFLEGPRRGNKKLAVLMVMIFNVGIWLVIIDNLVSTSLPFALAGRLCEAGAVVLFIILHWSRITTYRN